LGCSNDTYSKAWVVHPPFHIHVFRPLMVSSEELGIQFQARHKYYLLWCNKHVLEPCSHQANMSAKETMGRHMSGVTWQLVHPFELNCLFGP